MSCLNYGYQRITNKELLNVCGVVVFCMAYKLIDNMNDFHFDIRLKKRFFAVSGSLIAVNIFYKLMTR